MTEHLQTHDDRMIAPRVGCLDSKPHQLMNSPLLPSLSILAVIAAAPLQAASVFVPPLQTGGLPSANGLEIHSSTDHSVDLSNKSSLTSGQNILVTLAASEAPIYYSSFQPTGGAFSYQVTETLSLIIGGQTFSSSVVISMFAADVTPAPGTSHVVGYQIGDFFDVVAVSVPWNTDLSAVTVRLSQDGIISGGFFAGSNSVGVDGLIAGGTRLQNLALQLTSVPEPTALLYVFIGSLCVVWRRKRN